MKANEVYIIDHSRTTGETATSAGDFMWRWGNPRNYDYGGGSPATYSSWKWTKGQHDPRWIVDGDGYLTGNITIHNNHSVTNPKPPGGMFEAHTEIFELILPDSPTGYVFTAGQPYGPAAPTILAEYDYDLPYLNDGFASGAQKMPNGHVFSGSTTKFTLLEHDDNGNIVWYFDCRDLTPGGGQFWKPFKYPVGYVGFRQLGIAETNSLKLSIDVGSVSNGSCSVSFVGSEWLFYDVQASSNLQNWVTISSNTPGSGLFTDTVIHDWSTSSNVVKRYYRIREHR